MAVVGEVDLATAHLLRDRLLGVLREQAPAVLDVDLAGVTFLDCTGVSALVAVRNAATRSGCQVRVTHPRPVVRRVLDVTGLLSVLTAPIDQLPTTGRVNPAQAGPTPAAATRPPGVTAAA
ncbi:MAG TPA: STAS domain-containing protein [Micromonosporaceae bacterium]|nr:STAS domain-containing protein [Micromonosporaceae bacterium]